MTRGRDQAIELTAHERLVLEQVLVAASCSSVAEALGCSPETVRAEIASLLGKARGDSTDDAVVAVLHDRRALRISGVTLTCKPTSFALLSYLVERQGRWVSSEMLRSEVLRTFVRYGASNVRWHVLQARRALGRFSPLLHSDNRLGFMFHVNPCGRSHCDGPRSRPAEGLPGKRRAGRRDVIDERAHLR